MLLARFGNITVEAGRGLELSVVAAVVVGGVNIFGGSGTVSGAMLGAVMIGTLEQSLFRLGISQFWLDAVLGLLILLAVASDADAERIFALLSHDGEVFMPLQETFFATRFAQLRDRFGTLWMIIHERPMGQRP